MNDEQNTTGTGSANNGPASEGSSTTSTSPSTKGLDPDAAGIPRDEFTAIDHAKKDVLSSIGDGEMHNEGLAGAGDVPTDLHSSMDQSADEQGAAERAKTL